MIGRIVKRAIGSGVLVAFLAGAGCVPFEFSKTTPRPILPSELVGHWVADPGGLGEGDFFEDGTFTRTRQLDEPQAR